jgi:hypothetical protein
LFARYIRPAPTLECCAGSDKRASGIDLAMIAAR